MKETFLLLLTLILLSCSNEAKEIDVSKAVDEFKQIQGKWQLQPDGSSIELWETMNDGMIGRGMILTQSNDTSITEVYFLEPYNDSLRLQVQPINENGIAQPIDFFLTEHSKNRFVFENQHHNFPKKITYVIKKNTYEVLSEGEIGGNFQQMDLKYSKTP